MDPNLASLKTSGGPWRASSYHETGFCCKLLRRCPHSSLLGRHRRPLKAAGSLKKQKQKPNRAHCHSYTSRASKGAGQQRHQLAAEIFLLCFGFPHFVLLHTSAPEGFAMPTSPTMGKYHGLAAPTILNLPAAQDSLLPVL